MLRQILPVVSTVTKDNIEELRSIDMPLVIAFVEKNDPSSSDLFKSIAEEHQDQFLFGMSSDMSLSKANSINPPFIVLHSASDHIDRIFIQVFDSVKIERFLSGIATPLIGKFSMETYYTYTQVSSDLISLFRVREVKPPNSLWPNSPSYPSSTFSQQQNTSGNLLQIFSSTSLRNTEER